MDWWPVDRVRREMPETFSVRVTDALKDDAPAIRTHDGVNITQ